MGHRCSSDPALPWLWCRPAAAAPIQPLVWERPCAAGAALKSQTKQKKASLSPRQGRAPLESAAVNSDLHVLLSSPAALEEFSGLRCHLPTWNPNILPAPAPGSPPTGLRPPRSTSQPWVSPSQPPRPVGCAEAPTRVPFLPSFLFCVGTSGSK